MINNTALADYRTRAGLSQRKLATLIGVNYQVVRRIEAGGDAGNLTLRDLNRLSEALHVSPGDLLIRREPQPAANATPAQGIAELDIAQARLLRRVHRHEDLRRRLAQPDREIVLPSLQRDHLIRIPGGAAPTLTRIAAHDLAAPDRHEASKP